MNGLRILPIALLALALNACQASGAKHASIGKDFTLAVGKSAVVDGQNVEVRFVQVIEDSRCPLGLTCLWAGQVRVRLLVGGSEQDLLKGQSVGVGAVRVTVLEVNPEPVGNQKILPERYRVVVRVDLAAE